MNMLIYVPFDNVAGERLLQRLNSLTMPHNTEIYRHPTDLTERLDQPLGHIDIAVLMPGDRKCLEWLVCLYQKRLIGVTYTVVILPERRIELIRMSHRLFPRYLTDAGSDFRDVEAVVGNLIRRSRDRGFEESVNLIN